MFVTDIHAYHKLIADSYDERSKTYNNSEWHRTNDTTICYASGQKLKDPE